nr:MAG TPA: hypothetical protein [Caudoviricetes sp.]
MPFTPEELAELAAFDAEIDAEFEWTNEELRESRARDKEICFELKGRKAQKIAEAQRAYREANREKYNAYMREYMRRKYAERKNERALQRI